MRPRRRDSELLTGERVAVERPKVSVCMAAYQGERYIALQLRSILEQLSDSDEIIVVDDNSSDRTREEVISLDDARVQLLEHRANQGVAKSFQEALGHATGDIIFLSDQDDIWLHSKVARFLEIFRKNADVNVVISNAALIDENGNPLGRSYYELRGRFRSGLISNLIRCKFLGCLMAFRSALLPKVLPFPTGCGDVLHDFWIGTVNTMSSGKTMFLDEELVCYRRHASSVTAGKLSTARQMQTRWCLFKAVIRFLFDGSAPQRLI